MQKKTRGEQFLYVNNRFVKNPYLNHAIKSSMEDLIQIEQHPSYFIFLKIEPKLVDVNVHPNKTEVKFEDEKAIYQILQSACKRTIGMSNIKPSLDFSIEKSFEVPIHIQKSLPKEPKIKFNTNFNPFSKHSARDRENTQNIQKLFIEENKENINEVFNIDERYAIFKMAHDNTINIIDKKKSLERILYEQIMHSLKKQQTSSQLTIEPIKITLNIMDIQILQDNIKIVDELGCEMKITEPQTVTIKAIPDIIKEANTQEFIELLIDTLKQSNTNIKKNIIKKIAKKNAYQKSKKVKYPSTKDELIQLINTLLKCEIPFIGIDGKPSVITIEPNKIFN